MSFKNVLSALTADVATGGTFTFGYPTGTSRGDFEGGLQNVLLVGAGPGTAYNQKYVSPTDFTISYGALLVTVTYNGTTTLLNGSPFIFQLDRPGDHNPEPGTLDRVTRATVYRIDLGTPLALSAAALRAAAAVAGAGALALIAGTTTLDVPRNLTFLSSGNDSGITFAILGKDVFGTVMNETVTGGNATTANGKKAFKTITSITASGAAAANVSVGFGNVLGLPVFLPSTNNIVKEIQDEAAPSAGTAVAGLARNTKATATTADVRGTYVPNAAPDGTKGYGLYAILMDPLDLGQPQF